jgi:hypothetical protein
VHSLCCTDAFSRCQTAKCDDEQVCSIETVLLAQQQVLWPPCTQTAAMCHAGQLRCQSQCLATKGLGAGNSGSSAGIPEHRPVTRTRALRTVDVPN